MDEATCLEISSRLSSVLFFKLALSVHVFMDAISAVMSVQTIQTYAKALFHPNCKILLIFLIIIFIMYSVSHGVLLAYQILILSLPPSCATLFHPVFCLLIRMPSNVSMYSFTPIHFCLCLERIYARYHGKTYEKVRPFFGIAAAILSLTAGAVAETFIMLFEDYSDDNLVPFCSVGNRFTSHSSSYAMLFLLVVDFVSFTIIADTYYREKRHQQYPFRPSTRVLSKSYDSCHRFAAIERQDANSFLLPLTAVHTWFFFSYEVTHFICTEILQDKVSYLTFKSFFALINVTPSYMLVSNFMLKLLIRRLHKKKEAAWKELHHKQFELSFDYHKTYNIAW